MPATGFRSASGQRGMSLALLIAVNTAAAVVNVAPAQGPETRAFAVSVDGKPAGHFQMTIQPLADGSLVMTGDASVHVKYLVYHYKYVYQGTETWNTGQLQRLSSRSTDDGKNYAVQATIDRDALAIRVNGQPPVMERLPVWTTTFWQLPDPRHREGRITLLDADTGRIFHGRLDQVGRDQVSVGGAARPCAHYVLASDKVKAHLWYDEQERLVREDSTEDNHRTRLELTRITR